MDERTDGQKAAKAAFLAELKEQAQREGWARRTYHPEDRTYEARRYDDGVLCRRVDELKVGDRVRYIRRTNGQTVEGTVYVVTTMPEGTEDAGKLAYRLGLSHEDVEAIGHPVVVPHSRVELVWPESAIAATGFVLLHEGRRLGWKVLRGPVPAWHPDFRYYGTGPEAPSPTLCAVERQPFAAWDDAVTWCASFPAHPAETGRPPALDDMQSTPIPQAATDVTDDNDAPKGEE